MTIGELIRVRRRAHGLSQRQLAVRARTSQAAIAAIETGRRSPTMTTVENLLACFGEELDLEAGIRRSKWQDTDEQGLRDFQALSMEERLRVGIESSASIHELLGAATR